MAKGIITNIGSGGSPPKMVVTTFDSAIRHSLIPGDEVECSCQQQLQVGYLVEGNIVPSGNGITIDITTILDSTPVVITGNQSGNTTIGPDQAVLIQSTGQITGNVTVNGGALYVNGGKASGNISIGADSTIVASNNATIGGGTFEVTGAGNNAVVVIGNSTVNGKFATSGITFVNLGGNNFNGGNVSSTKDEYVTIKNNTINNNKTLTVSQVVVECKIANNTVPGGSTIDPKCTA